MDGLQLDMSIAEVLGGEESGGGAMSVAFVTTRPDSLLVPSFLIVESFSVTVKVVVVVCAVGGGDCMTGWASWRNTPMERLSKTSSSFSR